MSSEFKDFTDTPTLTFGTAPQPQAQPAVVKEEPKMDESILSPEERRMVDEFARQIDLRNSSGILQYGAGTQKKMADFSEAALENVKTKDLGQVGDMLTDVVAELKNFDAEEERGFLGFLKNRPINSAP